MLDRALYPILTLIAFAFQPTWVFAHDIRLACGVAYCAPDSKPGSIWYVTSGYIQTPKADELRTALEISSLNLPDSYAGKSETVYIPPTGDFGIHEHERIVYMWNPAKDPMPDWGTPGMHDMTEYTLPLRAVPTETEGLLLAAGLHTSTVYRSPVPVTQSLPSFVATDEVGYCGTTVNLPIRPIQPTDIGIKCLADPACDPVPLLTYIAVKSSPAKY